MNAVHILENGMAMLLGILFLTVLAHFLGLTQRSPKGSLRNPSPVPTATPASVAKEPVAAAQVTPCVRSDNYELRSMAVRQLDEGRATLIARHRPRKKGVSALLIIWAGAKRRKLQDSYYDLGVLSGASLSEQLVEEFESMAIAKLIELKAAGMQKRAAAKTAKAEAPAVEVVAAEAPAEVAITQPVVEVMPQESGEGQLKLLRFPALFRGVIAEIGMLPQERNGETFEVFGVRLNTTEGITEAVFGAQLRHALREAGATLGDQVEILKQGRKTMERGKAPMNIYKVTKLA